MNLPGTRAATLVSLISLAAALVMAASSLPARAQTNPAVSDDPLNAYIGTWIAKAPGENTPYLELKFQENDGKLSGTTTHFRMKVIGKGQVIGSPETAGESPLRGLTIGGAELFFGWDGDLRFQGLKAKFTLQGTRQAFLIFGLPAEKQQEIMKENPGATGFSPQILLRREMAEGTNAPTERTTPPWEARFMADLINTAEAQYKSAKGSYADYHTLVQSGQLEDTDSREFKILPEHFRSETDPLPGYRLRLLLSPDASSYQLSIQEDADCGTGLFTEEAGIVLEGRASDCPK
jgi:hypothetical protein